MIDQPRLGDPTVDQRVSHLWYSVLCNVFILTRNVLNFEHASQ